MAICNIIFGVYFYTTTITRNRKTEMFLSTILVISQAIPLSSMLWVTLERFIYNQSSKIRNSTDFKPIAIFRFFVVVVSILNVIGLKRFYEISELPDDDINQSFNKTTILSNYFIDYYYGCTYIVSIFICPILFQNTRVLLRGAVMMRGVPSDQRANQLKGQVKFFYQSYLPLFLVCFIGYVIQYIVKKTLDFENMDLIYTTSSTFLPLFYPISLVTFHPDLREDYLANYCLCRKAKKIHKESKVKVIATKESQDSIIANLKMIGILSDIDAVPGAKGSKAQTTLVQPAQSRKSSAVPSRPSIGREATSIGSIGSVNPKRNLSTASNNGNNNNNNMMFQTRNTVKKTSIVQ